MGLEKLKVHKEARKQLWICQIKTIHAALNVFYIGDCGDWHILRAVVPYLMTDDRLPKLGPFSFWVAWETPVAPEQN